MNDFLDHAAVYPAPDMMPTAREFFARCRAWGKPRNYTLGTVRSFLHVPVATFIAYREGLEPIPFEIWGRLEKLEGCRSDSPSQPNSDR